MTVNWYRIQKPGLKQADYYSQFLLLMNTIKKFSVGFILLLTFSSWVLAQDDLKLSYKEAVTIALENNVPLRQQNNNLTGIQANRTASYGSLAPNINAFGQGWRNDGNLFIEQEARVVNTTSDNIYGQLNAELLIFNGLSLMNTIKREEHNFDAQVSFIDRTKQNIISFVTVQYLTVLQDQEQVKIAKENVENQKVLLEQITAMFEAGSRAITDKYDQGFPLCVTYPLQYTANSDVHVFDQGDQFAALQVYIG